jgi:hypothetical protein
LQQEGEDLLRKTLADLELLPEDEVEQILKAGHMRPFGE